MNNPPHLILARYKTLTQTMPTPAEINGNVSYIFSFFSTNQKYACPGTFHYQANTNDGQIQMCGQPLARHSAKCCGCSRTTAAPLLHHQTRCSWQNFHYQPLPGGRAAAGEW